MKDETHTQEAEKSVKVEGAKRMKPTAEKDSFHKVISEFQKIVKKEIAEEAKGKDDKGNGKSRKGSEGCVGMLTKQVTKDLATFGRHEQNGWRKMSIAVDSRACVTVANPEDIPNYPVVETIASKNGEEFTGAGGDSIPNLGAMQVPVLTRESTQRLMNVTAAPVSKPLLSVKQLNKTGHLVVFDEDMSYILNKTTGELNMLREENGNFMFDVWVPPNSTEGFPGQP